MTTPSLPAMLTEPEAPAWLHIAPRTLRALRSTIGANDMSEAEKIAAERAAVVAYLNHAADEAHGLAVKANTDGAAAMMRAIGNAAKALGIAIGNGEHLAVRAHLERNPDNG